MTLLELLSNIKDWRQLNNIPGEGSSFVTAWGKLVIHIEINNWNNRFKMHFVVCECGLSHGSASISLGVLYWKLCLYLESIIQG